MTCMTGMTTAVRVDPFIAELADSLTDHEVSTLRSISGATHAAPDSTVMALRSLRLIVGRPNGALFELTERGLDLLAHLDGRDARPVSANTVSWVESVTGRTLDDGQARAVTVLRSIGAAHNLQLIGSAGWGGAVDSIEDSRAQHGDFDGDAPVLAPVVFGPNMVKVRLCGPPLATIDSDELTRLVLAGHDHAVRVELKAGMHLHIEHDADVVVFNSKTQVWEPVDDPVTFPAAHLEVLLVARDRQGDPFSAHPTIDKAVARWRDLQGR